MPAYKWLYTLQGRGGEMNWYELSKEEVERLTESNLETGLSEKDSQKKLKTAGYNQLQEGKKPSALLVFFAQFKDFMVLVPLAYHAPFRIAWEYLDAIAIILIVIMNGILGFIQERKAEKSLSALRELSAPSAMVMRNGSWSPISAKELVPGDLVRLSAGDRVGADIRMISAKGLYIEESALTGESIPVQKNRKPSGAPVSHLATKAIWLLWAPWLHAALGQAL